MENYTQGFREYLIKNKYKLKFEEPVTPHVITKRCNGCGICAKTCPALVIDIIDKKACHVNTIYCVECGHCVAVCPTNAVEDPKGGTGDYISFMPGELPSFKSMNALFRSRRSIRNYKEKHILEKDLQKIIDAGISAPAAGNRSDVNFLVLSSPEEVEKIRDPVFDSVYKTFSLMKNRIVYFFALLLIGRENAKTTKFYIPIVDYFREIWKTHGIDRLFYNAPAAIIVHGKKYDETIPFSCAAALYQSSLMAQAINIGCCFNGFLQVAINRDPKIKKMLGIPKKHNCYGAMTLGYPKYKYKRSVRSRETNVNWR